MKHALKLLPAALLAFSFGAQADIAITIQQVGENIVVKGSGSLATENVTCMPYGNEVAPTSAINQKEVITDTFGMQLDPIAFLFNGLIQAEWTPNASICTYPITAKEGTGLGSFEGFVSGSSEGDFFGFNEPPYQNENNRLIAFLPPNYTSGSNLQFSGLIAGKSLSDLGLVVGGSLKWTVSTEPIEQPTEENPPTLRKAEGVEFLSITVLGAPAPAAATPVPALGAFGLIGLAGAIGAAGVAMNRRRKQ